MFDTAENDQYPASAAAYAGYVDGGIGDQPNYAHIVSAYPGAHHLSIALSAGNDADVLDVENGAASPADIPGWHARQVARGIVRPVIYASVSAMNDAILPVLKLAGIGAPHRRLWTAHYGAGEHICGPKSCGALSGDADGTQWTPNAMGRNLDQSLLDPDFFGTPAPPPPPSDWVFGKVRGLAVSGIRSAAATLTWDSPGTPMPAAVGHYEVTVRAGGADLPHYPVSVPKGPNPQKWRADHLVPGAKLEAMVRAVAADGSRASEWATIEFTTPN